MNAAGKKKSDLLAEIESLRSELSQHDPKFALQERLRALAQMARGIVHDFNNALTPIIGAADFMITHDAILDSREDTVHMLECIRAAGGEAKSMVTRLRAFYRPAEEVEIRAVYLNPLIRGVLQLLEPTRRGQEQRKNLVIDIETDLADVPAIRASEAQIREVLANIVTNSITAMPHGGRIVVSTACIDDQVSVTIRDTGMGMSEEILEHCFEPFFSTKPGNGAGIGLAMAYFVVQNCSGSINISSEPGVGTTVVLSIPAYTAAGEPPASAMSDAPARPLKILLLEKDELIREVLVAYLRAAGHELEVNPELKPAIDMMRLCRFDTVLLGEKTVGVHIGDVASALREDSKQTAVVLLRSYDATPGFESNRPPGVDAVLDRSATCAELIETVLKASDEKQQAAVSS